MVTKNRSAKWRAWLGGSCAFVLLCCNSPVQRALLRAEQAYAKGDLALAAMSYREACKLDPTDEAVCQRAELTTQAAVDASLRIAQPRCVAGDAQGCLDALRPARDLRQDERVLQLVDLAAQAHVRRCAAFPMVEPEDAVLHVRCLEAASKAVGTASYQKVVRDERLKAASLVRSVIPAGSTSQGSAHVLFGLAYCLGGEPPDREERERALGQFLAAAQVPWRLTMTGPGGGPAPASFSCEHLTGRLPLGARCAMGADKALEVGLQVELLPPTHQTTQTYREVRYVAGTRTVRNPEHDRLRDEHRSAKRAYEDAQRDYRVAQADCDSADQMHFREGRCYDCYARTLRDTACNRAEALRVIFNERVDDYNQLVAAKNRTPETSEQVDYDTFRYLETGHRWDATYRFALRLGNTTQNQQGLLSFSRVEHPGFPPANLAEKPLRVPMQSEYHEQLVQQLQGHLLEALAQELRARGQRRRAECGAAPAKWQRAWLECWTEATLWSGGDLLPHFSEWLGGRLLQRYEQAAMFPKVACVR